MLEAGEELVERLLVVVEVVGEGLLDDVVDDAEVVDRGAGPVVVDDGPDHDPLAGLGQGTGPALVPVHRADHLPPRAHLLVAGTLQPDLLAPVRLEGARVELGGRQAAFGRQGAAVLVRPSEQRGCHGVGGVGVQVGVDHDRREHPAGGTVVQAGPRPDPAPVVANHEVAADGGAGPAHLHLDVLGAEGLHPRGGDVGGGREGGEGGDVLGAGRGRGPAVGQGRQVGGHRAIVSYPPVAGQDGPMSDGPQDAREAQPQPEGAGPTKDGDRVVVLTGQGMGVAGGEQAREAAAMVEQPAKVMRIGSMIKQLLEEAKEGPLDDAARARLAGVHERSLAELEQGLSPDLVAELRRITLPFSEGSTPSDAELRIAQAQLVGWLEGLFHGIQAAVFAQQMAAQAQLQQIRKALPGAPGLQPPPSGPEGPGHRPQHGTGQYL